MQKESTRKKNDLSLHRANFITLAFSLSRPERVLALASGFSSSLLAQNEIFFYINSRMTSPHAANISLLSSFHPILVYRVRLHLNAFFLSSFLILSLFSFPCIFYSLSRYFVQWLILSFILFLCFPSSLLLSFSSVPFIPFCPFFFPLLLRITNWLLSSV